MRVEQAAAQTKSSDVCRSRDPIDRDARYIARRDGALPQVFAGAAEAPPPGRPKRDRQVLALGLGRERRLQGDAPESGITAPVRSVRDQPMPIEPRARK